MGTVKDVAALPSGGAVSTIGAGPPGRSGDDSLPIPTGCRAGGRERFCQALPVRPRPVSRFGRDQRQGAGGFAC